MHVNSDDIWVNIVVLMAGGIMLYAFAFIISRFKQWKENDDKKQGIPGPMNMTYKQYHEQRKSNKCPKCGKPTAQSSRFCPSCGSEIVNKGNSIVKDQKSRFSENAEMLFNISQLLAISSLVPTFERVPILQTLMKDKRIDTWDFFVTVAGVGTGMFEIIGKVPEGDVKPIGDAIRQRLNQWDKQGYTALDDFVDFVGRNVKGGIPMQTAVGLWVVWNIKSAEPTNEEMSTAPVIGGLICTGVSGAWG